MIELKNITKIYKTKGGEPVRALDDVSIVLPDKGLVFILGKSGCGKSTLLNIAGGLDKPTSGEIVVKGRSSKNFSQSDFDSYRNTYVGFIFQEYNVMPEFSVKENVTLATELQGKRPKDGDLQGVLGDVELGGLEKRKPLTLSGGQKQRVAIARALVKDPQIILADEPTGALDSNTGKAVLDLLKRLSENKLVVVVSHDRDFANRYADRIIELHDGKVISDMSFVRDEETTDMAVIGDKVHVAGDLTAEMLDRLNEVLRKKKVVTLSLNTDVDGIYGGRFVETRPEDIKGTNSGAEKLIRSKFPFKYALRMGASGLKTKRFRLILTIILSTAALTALGFMLTLMGYNGNKVLRNALDEGGQTELGVANYKIFSYTVPIVNMEYENKILNLSDAERIQALSEQTGCEFMKIHTFASDRNGGWYDLHFADRSDIEPYYPNGFCGFAEADEEQLKRFGGTLKKGNFPQTPDEIMISDLAVEAIYYLSVKDNKGQKLMKNFGDLPIGKPLMIGNNTKYYTICGIFTAPRPAEKFDKLKNLGAILTAVGQSDRKALNALGEYRNLTEELSKLYSAALSTVVLVHRDFFAANASFFGVKNFVSCYSGSDNYNYNSFTADIGTTADAVLLPEKSFTGKACLVDHESIYGLVSILQSGKMISDDQANTLYEMIGSHDDTNMIDVLSVIEDMKPGSLSRLEMRGSDVGEKVGVSVVGVLNRKPSEYDSRLYFTKEAYDALFPAKDGYDLTSADFLLGVNTDRLRSAVVSDAMQVNDEEDRCFRLYENYQEENVTNYNEIIAVLSGAFFWVGVVIAAFAALLLFSFISASISFKKREIGILRALGARKVDVFKVFFSESMMIIYACYLLSVIFTIILSIYVGNRLKEDFFVSATLFFFGPLQALILGAFATAVAFISTVLPVYHHSKKPPVDAIRSL